MEDTTLPHDLAETAAPATARDMPPLIAPWWHTAAIVALLGTWAAISHARQNSYTGTPHPITYISMMLMTWMIFGSVVAGIIHRRAFFFNTLRHKARSFQQDVASGLAIYFAFALSMLAIAFVIFYVSILIHHPIHLNTPDSTAQPTQSLPQPKTQAGAPLPPPAPATPEPASPFGKSHFTSKTVLAIAPRTPLDMLLWIAISCTAGFCEEHIFRGYLLKQAIAFTRRAGASRLFANILSIALTSLLFGSLHLYEGVAGALIITALGAVYCVVSLELGNLRAVIAAHFLQDFISGLFLFLFHNRLTH